MKENLSSVFDLVNHAKPPVLRDNDASRNGEHLHFPLIESLIDNSQIDTIVAEMSGLCGKLESSIDWCEDIDISIRAETARVGILETVHLLETLRQRDLMTRAGETGTGDIR